MKALFIFTLIVVLFTACPKHTPVGPERPPEGCQITETRAKELAANFLEAADVDWGEPEKVTHSDTTFYFTYETPGNEIALLGPRMVLVDCVTGKTRFVMRD